MASKTEQLLIRSVFDEIKKTGKFPDFGSPETKCKKCMFHEIACFPPSGTVGCYGGWKKEGEKNETRKKTNSKTEKVSKRSETES